MINWGIPDDLMTVEEYAQRRITKPSPEQLLMARMLAEAVIDLRRGPDGHREWREVYAQTRAWISSDDLSWPYSFTNLCMGLGLDPDHVRDGMLAIKPTTGRVVDLGLRDNIVRRDRKVIRTKRWHGKSPGFARSWPKRGAA